MKRIVKLRVWRILLAVIVMLGGLGLGWRSIGIGEASASSGIKATTNNVTNYNSATNAIQPGRWSYLQLPASGSPTLLSKGDGTKFATNEWAQDINNSNHVWFVKANGQIGTDNKQIAYNFTMGDDQAGRTQRVHGAYNAVGSGHFQILLSQDTSPNAVNGPYVTLLDYTGTSKDFDLNVTVEAGQDLLFVSSDHQYWWEPAALNATVDSLVKVSTNNVTDYNSATNAIKPGSWSYLQVPGSGTPGLLNKGNGTKFATDEWAQDINNANHVWFVKANGQIGTDYNQIAYNYTASNDQVGEMLRVHGTYQAVGSGRFQILLSKDANPNAVNGPYDTLLDYTGASTDFDFNVTLTAGQDILFVSSNHQYWWEPATLNATVDTLINLSTNNIADYNSATNAIQAGRWSYLQVPASGAPGLLSKGDGTKFAADEWAKDINNTNHVGFVKANGQMGTDYNQIAYNYTPSNDQAGKTLRVHGAYRAVGSGHLKILLSKEYNPNAVNGPYDTLLDYTGTSKDFDLNVTVYAGQDILFVSSDHQYWWEPATLDATVNTLLTTGPVNLSGISKTNPGNIFAANESVSIPLVFKNDTSSSYTLNATYAVKDWNGQTSNSGSFAKTIAAHGTATQTIAPSVSLKGTYSLEVTAVSTNPSLTLTKSIPFSVVAPLSGSVGDGLFGVNMHADQSNKGDNTINIALAKKAGVQWIRDTIEWRNVEQVQGVYTFPANLEDEVNQAKSAGMQVLLVLCYSNGLYQADGTATPHTAAQYTAFANYAAAVAQHFAGRVNHFEVWNEWNGGMGNPERYGPSYYTDLLKATYTAVKGANPNAIIIGGVNSTVDESFIGGILSSGGYNYMDSVSYHPYADPKSAEVGNAGWYSIPSSVASVNKTFTDQGYTPKKIWLSEYGWSTFSVNGYNIDEPHQAAYEARAFVTGMANSQAVGGISKMFEYDFQDDGTDPNDKELHWGLIRNWAFTEVPYSAKQSYVSYAATTAMLKGAVYQSTTNIDRVRMIKFTRAADNKDIVVLFNLDDASVPIGIRGATAANMQAYDMFGNAIGIPSTLTYAPVYLVGALGSFNPEEVAASNSTILGDTAVESGSSSANSGKLFAEKVFLAGDAFVRSLSLYVKTAAGNVRMGVYADNGGAPGALVASTPEFAPAAGWNTVAVSSPALLSGGTYWLAYQPSSNSLAVAYETASTGITRNATRTYGALPAAFPTSAAVAGKPSLYATFHAPSLVNNAIYTIEALSSPGLLLNVGGTADGSKTSLTNEGAWWGSANTMKWKAVNAGSGYWKFYPQSSTNFALNDKGGAASGTQTQIGTDDGSDAVLWKLKLTQEGYYQLSPKNAAGLALDVSGSGTANGTPVQVYTINGSNAQKWKFNFYSLS
ncbi:RICIN domain-containing protein [Cohnella sp. GCM10020058]|uniref:RICIN domain-containing protein n=1 Tax=Cohnella sp. GCM10020058 TaxID=3317330 RepID=UPI00362BED11